MLWIPLICSGMSGAFWMPFPDNPEHPDFESSGKFSGKFWRTLQNVQTLKGNKGTLSILISFRTHAVLNRLHSGLSDQCYDVNTGIKHIKCLNLDQPEALGLILTHSPSC